MDFFARYRATFIKTILGLTVIICLVSSSAFAVDTDDSQTFIAGFNAYQKKDYPTAIDDMKTVLKKYPDSPLRDMALFWLARASYKSGDMQTAAKTMSQFFREYPDSPLKTTVEDDLLKLVAKYDKGEAIPGAAPQAVAEAPKTQAPSVAEAEAALKAASAKAEAQRAATEKAAAAKAEADRLAAEQSSKAAAEKLAAEKAEADRIAAQKAAAAKAEADRIAAEKAAAAKAEADRIAAEQALKAAAAKAEAERVAAENAAAAKAAADKLAAEKAARLQSAETERVATASEPAPAEPSSFDKLMAEKAAALKSIESQERLDQQGAAPTSSATASSATAAQPAPATAPSPAAAPAPVSKPAPAPAPVVVAQQAAPAPEAARPAKRRPQPVVTAVQPAPKHVSATAAAYRDKAIAGYKSVIERFPGTRAAADAEQKLKELGIPLPAPRQQVAQASPTTQVLNLEVGQFANVDFTVLPVGDTLEVGKRYTIPFEAINRGNGDDRFTLVSGFPAEFDVRFAAARTPDTPISVTPTIAPGEKFKGVIVLTIPRTNIDGQRNVYPVKLVSQVSGDASQSREVSLVSSAPLMRAVIKSDKGMVPPGGKVTYRIALLNIGTSAARDLTLRLNYPPQFEPVDTAGTPFSRESATAMTLKGLKVNSGESREYTVVFRVKDEAIARQELFCRADVLNGDLDTSDSFLSTVAYVETISGVTARTAANKLVVIPGQTVTVPIVVTNTGNAMDSFSIKPAVTGGLSYSFYHDLNRDGMRQSNEPAITRIGPLAPKEEAYILMEIATPYSVADGTTATVDVAFEPESDQAKQATVATRLAFSRPLIEMTLSGKGGKIKPGQVVSVDLDAVNKGTNMAKVVEVQTTIPGDLDVVASDPPYIRGNGGEYIWKFDELGAGEKRNIRLSFRVKPGVAMGTAIQVKNVLNYRDQLGNRY